MLTKPLRLFSILISALLGVSFFMAGIVLPSEIPADNAARYYIQAVDLLHYPQTKTKTEKLNTVIAGGWQRKNKDLAALLQQNQAALDKFKQGTMYPKCDFFGQTDTPGERGIFGGLNSLSKIAHLQARYFESRKKGREALDTYLSVLTLASHAAQEENMVAFVLAVSLEQKTLPLLKEYLKQRATRDDCVKIAAFLAAYGKTRFRLKSAVDGEKRFFLAVSPTIEKTIIVPDAFTRQPAAQADFRRLFSFSAQQAADKYYGMLAEAAEKNSETMWKKIDEDIERAAAVNVDKLFADLRKEVARKRDVPEMLVRQIVESILVGNILPRGMRRLADRYYRAGQDLMTLQQAAAYKAR